VLIAVGVFALADALFLAQSLHEVDLGGIGLRLGAAGIIWLISLIGGRVVPSFSRNWLARHGAKRMPVPFGKADLWVIGLATLALAAWVLLPDLGIVVAPLAVLAGLGHLWRVWRWGGWQALSEPLVWILHVAYLFIPVGFFMLAAGYGDLGAAAPGAVPHGWTAGAVALMTLAMMTRASLGHSGRMLTAGRGVTAIYLLAIGAALSRIVAEYDGNASAFLDLAGGLWILAFATFVIVFWPLLSKPRA